MARSFRQMSDMAAQSSNSTRVIPGKSIMTVRVGGQNVPIYIGKRCTVCQSPFRFEIEKLLLAGMGPATIADQLPEDNGNVGDARINRKHISNHVHASPSHCLPKVAALQMVVTSRQQQLGRNIEDAVGFLADYQVVGQMMLQNFFEQMMNGQAYVSETAAIQLIKMQADMDRQLAGGVDTAAYNDLFMVMLDAVRELAPGAYEQIVHRVVTNPIAASLEAKQKSIETTSRG